MLPHLQESIHDQLSGAAAVPQSAGLQAPWFLVSQMLRHLQKPCMVSCQEQNPCHNQEVFKLCCSLVSLMLPHLHIVCTVSCQTQPPCHIQQVFMSLVSCQQDVASSTEDMHGQLSGVTSMPQSAGHQAPWSLVSQMLAHLQEAMYVQLSGAASVP